MPQRDQSEPLANSLRTTAAFTDFHRDRICSPLPDGEKASHFGATYFPDSQRTTFPAPVVVPLTDPAYLKLCEEAFRTESALVAVWSAARRACNETSAPLFDELLTDNRVARAILLRMDALRNSEQHMGAGIYLGSKKFDETIGDLLFLKVRGAYEKCGLPEDDQMRALCKHWGTIQARARTAIIEETWKELLKGDEYPVPEGFFENMSNLLEHNVVASLRGEDESWRIPEATADAFWGWFSQVETLHQIKPSVEVLDRLKLVRNFIRSGTSVIPAELSDDLSRSGNSAWLSALKNPSISNINRFRESVWGATPEVLPVAMTLQEGCIHCICISDQQALEFWREYLAHPSIQEIEILTPNSRDAVPWHQRALRTEMRELASLPLSPFITRLTTDVAGASVEEVSRILDGKMHFLETLAGKPLWRSLSSEQTIHLDFVSPSPQVLATFKNIAAGRGNLANLRIEQPVHQDGALEIAAHILPLHE
jgi:hypothetical protein